ncbi:unannotated protein [freshwater metagenome]|uniref:Unannotated protein n=1 Tax=freshwater metagenome TaxID=449393 RepID=A0A6J6SQ77_9ZZZZ
MSSRTENPDNSVAKVEDTTSSVLASSKVAATARPATAAVPCPITTTFRIDPDAKRFRTFSGIASSPRATSSRPAFSTILPRKVLRSEAGDSVISLSKKCGAAPRFISRVVISARSISCGSSNNSEPS